MSKPNDIPQDVWDAAWRCQREIERQHVNVETIARSIMAERERCIAAIEAQKAVFASDEYATPQPLGSLMERFACDACVKAVRGDA